MIGLMLPTIAAAGSASADPSRVLDTARRAEAAGFDGVFAGDHLVYPRPMLECVTTLAAVAAVTHRISVGSCVLLAALRQPLVLARQLATLAAFAGGRLRIGIGVGGEYPAEFTAAGVSIAERGSLTAAAVTELRTELALDPGLAGMRSLGAHLPGRANPVPPFFFAGAQQVALRRAAELGDGWIGYSHSPEGFARRRSLVLRHRAARGLEPAGFVTGMVLPVHLGARTDSARNITAQRLISGSASEVLDALGRYWQAGCTEMVLQLGDDGPGYQEQLDAVSSVVLPALRAL